MAPDHDGWQVFQTMARRWWAIKWDLTLTEILAGHKTSLDADDLDELAQMIADQNAARA